MDLVEQNERVTTRFQWCAQEGGEVGDDGFSVKRTGENIGGVLINQKIQFAVMPIMAFGEFTKSVVLPICRAPVSMSAFL